MNIIISLFAVYIMIFLFGMLVMRIGLNSLSRDRIQDILASMTSNPLIGLFIGAISTAVIQSSSAIMIITIGLVSVGILSFERSIGIILGTNIGTTITAEIITFDLDYFIVPLLILGTIFLLIRNHSIFCIGCILFGLGCLFTAMNGFENLALPMSAIYFIKEFIIQTNESLWVGVIGGTLMTAVIQSSSAMTGVVMGFMTQKLISLPAGIAIVLGANIGTCITAYIASIGTKIESKFVAYAHIWINIIGVVLFFPLINSISSWITLLTPMPDEQLAHVSVIFNVIASLIILPFATSFSRFICKLHGGKK
jgi:phosphate:Na+ symporter